MTRPIRGFRAIAGLVGILAVCMLAPAHGQANLSYSARTTQVLDQLAGAERAIAAGDAGGAQAAMDGIGRDIDDLVRKATAFREVANQELGRCGSRVQDLDRRIGEIRTEQERVNTEIARLEETLAATSERQRLSAEHIAELNQRIAAANAALAEKARRLDELQKWWWVPGYGLYLGIRTLADHDIEEVRSLSNTLNDERVRVNQAGTSLQDDSRLKAQLVEQIRTDTVASGQLVAMHKQATAHMQELRAMALFLTEAEAFWLKASSVLGVTARGAAGDLQLLTSLLGKELTLTEFDEEFQPGKTTMRDALLGFAAAVDDGSSFLLESSTDYCGGPPRAAAAPTVSQRCNIDSITRYYEIIDPVTCSFRYANPPGCPPAARTVDIGTAAIDAGRQRGSWTRADDQNWVGRPSTSPCLIEGAVFYGKLAGPDQCEAVCQADAGCTAWTYNVRNGFMPGSTSQCWGVAQDFSLNKSAWTGFVSGGLR
jgi:flagellar biosynthesis chaperone FliJ